MYNTEVLGTMIMGKTCGLIAGILATVGGAALLLFGLGTLGASIAYQISGVAFTILGVSVIIHAAELCPTCNAKRK